MKRKYTLKELRDLRVSDKLEDHEFGEGIAIGVVGYGLAFGYGLYQEGVLVYLDKPYSLTLGLVRALNKLLKERNRNEK